MSTDLFWKRFWLIFGSLILACICANIAFFVTHVSRLDAAAVGVSYTPGEDPFSTKVKGGTFALISGYIYRDSLPLGAAQWAWDASVNWHSNEQEYEGLSSMKITFDREWSGMGMSGFSVPISQYHSLSLALSPEASVEDIFIELYDKKGLSMGRQSLAFYTSSGAFKPGEWQEITIPLSNLTGSLISGSITGISLTGKHAGVAFVDAIQFSADSSEHALWVEPHYTSGPPFNPFATSTPQFLPYTLSSFSSDDFYRFYSYYGSLSLTDGMLAVGPGNGSSDAVALFRGGRAWKDYQINARVFFGETSKFALLLRATDPGNFISCSFSLTGQEVQMYKVSGGTSEVLAESGVALIAKGAPVGSYVVGAKVVGDTVSCSVNGYYYISKSIPTINKEGTVGFEAWDPSGKSSPHRVVEVEVNPAYGDRLGE